MSTLQIRHPVLPRLFAWPALALARAGAFAAGAFEVFAEAQEAAREADRRFPYMIDECSAARRHSSPLIPVPAFAGTGSSGNPAASSSEVAALGPRFLLR